ncbi:MAG: ABC transporter substrate-binding protein [Tunicatimonas sp.]
MMLKKDNSILIGAMAPTTNPGWIEAGLHLLAGIELSVSEVNNNGGINRVPIKLVVLDSAANPQKASDLADELADLGVVAIVGEYHSVAAKAIADKADERNVPFLCTSAVIDNLIDKPSKWIARLPQVQSNGWKVYAEFLMNNKHMNIALVTAPSIYWKSGAYILHEQFSKHGGSIVEFDTQLIAPTELCDKLVDSEATALLLLVGYPDPAIPLVKAIRNDTRLKNLLIGAPAGQPEFNGWINELGTNGSAIPFLRYMPEKLNPLGQHVLKEIRKILNEEPSFVALEGYDAIRLLAKIMDLHGINRNSIAESWSQVTINGTRGEIKLSQSPEMNLWQWQEAPVQVVDRDPFNQNQFRVLYSM